MKNVVLLWSLIFCLCSCDIANNYTEEGKYSYQYRRPVALMMSDALDSLRLTGNGINIGIVDAGFGGFKQNEFTRSLTVKDYRDFIDNDTTNFFADEEHEHGTVVASSVGGVNGNLVHGLARNANYFLAKTDDANTELAIEETRLIEAIDWLISKKVDVINLSVAYTNFDDAQPYTQANLDGNTALCSRHIDSVLQANPALIIVVSAGNKGNKEWSNIMFPGDVKEAITVGSTDFDGINHWKSSGVGYAGTDYIKPDVATYPIPLGNSHTAPVITGLCAIIKERYPSILRKEVINALHTTSSNASNPNLEIGYGVPNSKELLIELDQ